MVTISVNERPVTLQVLLSLEALAKKYKPEADIFIINGYPVTAATLVKEGDQCWLIKRGEIPEVEEINHLLYARHTPGVQEKIKNAVVGIMGLGGLGSVVAMALARIGIGQLLLVDYDVVEPSNLNRQQYFIDQIGMKKTEALKSNLLRVNPYVAIVVHDMVLTEENIPEIFRDVDVLAECFDSAAVKAAALRSMRLSLPEKPYVTASGLAGYGANNTIHTRKLYANTYMVGDEESAAAPGQGLMAPRVGIAAHHQANQILRILLGEVD